MILANKPYISLVDSGGGILQNSAGVADYPAEFSCTLFSNCRMATCEPQGGEGLGYHTMTGEIDTIKSINGKYIDIGELARIISRNNVIARKGSGEKLRFHFGQIQSYIQRKSPCMYLNVCLREPLR